MPRQQSKAEAPSSVERVIHAVCEGQTERHYLLYFNKEHGITHKFEILPFDRMSFDRDQSDRMHLVDLITGWINREVNGRYTPYMYVTDMLHVDFDAELSDYYDKKLSEGINEVRDSVLKKLNVMKPPIVDEAGDIVDFDRVNCCIEDCIRAKQNLSYYWKGLDTDNIDMRYPKTKTTFDCDRVLVLFDRDKDIYGDTTRTIKAYEKVLDTCKERGYVVLMSSPAFEFWLLLHHSELREERYSGCLCQNDDVLDDLADYERDCGVWKEPYDKIKSISESRFERYYSGKNFDTAVMKSQHLFSDPRIVLKKELNGTNVGIELNKLLK